MVKLRAWLLLILLLPTPLLAAEISVRVDPDPVPVDQSFQITFEAEGDVDDAPDFAPLQGNFQVLSSSQSRNVTFRNGKSSSTRTWTLTVLARRQGTLTIPPIEFGSDLSPADSVTVTAAGTAPQAARQSGEIFLEVEAKPLSAYVQSQIIYTVRLFLGIQPGNASLSDPVVEEGKAVIERLGEDRQYETRVMGQRFEVIERNYAIYPQSSGPLTIGPLRFQGQLGGRSVFSLLDPFGPQPRPIARQSAPVTLGIKPIPAGFAGRHWLPARKLVLSEQWSADPFVFHAGEPITRTLTITAEGQTSSQLPELSPPVPGEFRAYPDQPVLADDKAEKDVIGTRQEKIALIPQQPGEYELPEVTLPWWNTETDRMEVARLAARRVKVLPAADAVTAAPAAAPAAEVQPAQSRPIVTRDAAWYSRPATWQIIALLLAAGWILTLLLWRRSRKALAGNPAAAYAPGRAEAVRRLKQACSENDPALAKNAALLWAKLEWPGQPPANLADLALRCPPQLAAGFEALNAALYGRAGRNWNGAELWRAFEGWRPVRPGKQAPPQDGLEPLFRL